MKVERIIGRALTAWLMAGMLALSLPAHATERGALFKVSGQGHTLYLFGTMHVGRPDFYPFEPRFDAILTKAPVLALEVDPAIPADVAARTMRQYALAPPGMVTPPGLAPRLARVLAAQGVPADAMAPFKPWLIATVLTLNEFTRLGYSQADAVDSRLAALARQRGVKVVELESIGAQLSLLASMPLADQWTFVDDTLRQIDSGKSSTDSRKLAQAWATADRTALDAVAAQLASDATVSGRFMREVLLDGRNGALADGVASLMQREDNSVAAIGVLHLLGKGSVTERLRAKGLSVERVY
jgi:uncharacterized protein YbaP (TraB family)